MNVIESDQSTDSIGFFDILPAKLLNFLCEL